MDHFAYRDGALFCEDVPVAEIVGEVGTPAYVYSSATLLHHYRAIAEAFGDLSPTICYSIKSLANVNVLKLLVKAGTIEPTEKADEKPLSAASLADLAENVGCFRSRMLGFMEAFDVLICPVNAYPALPHGSSSDNTPAFSYTMAFNLTGWPAVVVRAGTSPEGLPIGVQVVARPWNEHHALAVAEHLERTIGGWREPPL